MADKAVVTQTTLDAIGQAIIAKGGATAPMTPAQMASAIAAIPSGGWTRKDWRNDGKTHIWIDWKDESLVFYLNIHVKNQNPFKVYWGDGTYYESSVQHSSYVLINLSHEYSQAGIYELIIDISEGDSWSSRGDSNGHTFSMSDSSSSEFKYTASRSVKQAELSNYKLNSTAQSMFSVPNCEYIKISKCDADIVTSWFTLLKNEFVLKEFVFEDSFLNPVAFPFFLSGSPIESLVLAEGFTGANTNSSIVSQNGNLRHLYLPSTTVNAGSFVGIGTYVEDGCEIVCMATTPPNVIRFWNMNIGRILVPDESVEAYKDATNWSSYRDKIFGIEEAQA